MWYAVFTHSHTGTGWQTGLALANRFSRLTDRKVFASALFARTGFDYYFYF